MWCLSGDRWRRSAPAEKRDDDEVSGAEAGARAEAQLPHRQAQAELAVILRQRCAAGDDHRLVTNASTAVLLLTAPH